jgi:hypothetical protein
MMNDEAGFIGANGDSRAEPGLANTLPGVGRNPAGIFSRRETNARRPTPRRVWASAVSTKVGLFIAAARVFRFRVPG